MVTLMAVTTAGVQLIPASMIGVLARSRIDQPDGDHRSVDRRNLRSVPIAAVIAARAAAALSIRRQLRRAGGALVMRAVLDAISVWAIPVLLVVIPLVGIIRRVKVYDVFIEGAKEGFDVAVKIIPFLVGILVAIGMFRGPAPWIC